MSSKPLYDDPVVAEICLIRERMLAECGGKPDEFFRRLREGARLQAAAGRAFVDGPVAKHVNLGLAGTVEPE